MWRGGSHLLFLGVTPEMRWDVAADSPTHIAHQNTPSHRPHCSGSGHDAESYTLCVNGLQKMPRGEWIIHLCPVEVSAMENNFTFAINEINESLNVNCSHGILVCQLICNRIFHEWLLSLSEKKFIWTKLVFKYWKSLSSLYFSLQIFHVRILGTSIEEWQHVPKFYLIVIEF